MWLFENILNETGEFHPTFAKFVDGSNMDAIPELAENISGHYPHQQGLRAIGGLPVTGQFYHWTFSPLSWGLCCQETKMLLSISEELEHLSSQRLAGTSKWRLHSLSDRLVHWQ